MLLMGATPAAGYLQQEDDGRDIWGGGAALGGLLQPLILLLGQGWKHSTGSLESGRILQLMGQRMPRRPRDCWHCSSAARHTARQGCRTPPSGMHLGTKRLQMRRRRCW